MDTGKKTSPRVGNGLIRLIKLMFKDMAYSGIKSTDRADCGRVTAGGKVRVKT